MNALDRPLTPTFSPGAVRARTGVQATFGPQTRSATSRPRPIPARRNLPSAPVVAPNRARPGPDRKRFSDLSCHVAWTNVSPPFTADSQGPRSPLSLVHRSVARNLPEPACLTQRSDLHLW